MEAVPSLTAICVNYNGAQVLPRLLECLRSCRRPLQILVVDSASRDGSADHLGSDVHLLRLRENLGYAAALNAGLRLRLSQPDPPDFFLLLNNDVEFEPGGLEALISCAQAEQAWVAGPQVVSRSDPRRLDAAWGRVDYSHVLARYRGKGAPASRYRQRRRTELLLGCVLLVKRQTLEKVGFFDERYFMYHEEVDFLYRCAQAGLRVCFCPAARFLHRGAHSTRRSPLKKVYWLRRNTLFFMFKHRPGALAWLYWAATLAGSLAFNTLLLRTARLGAILRGVRDGFKTRGRQTRLRQTEANRP
ncbi:MAG TPA: glycosyltransferase family 2 protein [Acidobacteriota bacterium]|nr:glycosyltransferase family 2 protein [Acidobacteriota bacterium]